MKHKTRSSFGPAPRRAVCIILWLAFAAATSWAEPLTVVGSSSGSREATVKFEMVGSQLWITLSNTSMADALYPTDMLGGVFFDVANDPILTPLWARVDTGSCLIYPTDSGCTSPVEPGPVNTNKNIGGEWAYHRDTSGSPISQDYGIGAVGLGFFSKSDRFDTAQNLAVPVAIDGGNSSLAPKGDIPTTDNGGIDHNHPYVWYSAVFAFTPPASFNPSAAISNVRFQYGTGFSKTSILAILNPVPEPATLALIGSGLIGFGIALRRRRAAR